MDDLIRRDDVYGVLKKVNIREMPIYVFDKLWNGVRDLPSAEPERKAKVKEGWGLAMCCACKKRVFPYDKYCPNCGCRLEWEYAQ